MQAMANDHGIALRPHIKTHKIPELALNQQKKGANGIATSTLHEAEVMEKSGIFDIQVANEVIQFSSIEKLYQLSNNCRITCAVDSKVGAERLNNYFQARSTKAGVLVDIDTGLNRSGLKQAEDVIDFCQYLESLPGIQFEGIMSHAGHSYGASSQHEIEAIAKQEGGQMAALSQKLREAGLPSHQISVGATPAAHFSVKNPDITELRVGNYVFNDCVEMALGTATESGCALTVLSTVISNPEPGRAVIDAGSKSLTADQGAHGKAQISGFGKIVGKKGELYRLSEEHGVISYNPKQSSFQVGTQIQIIPNHACPVINLFDKVYLVNENEVIKGWEVKARGH